MMKNHDGLLISYDDSHQFLTTDMHIGSFFIMQDFNKYKPILLVVLHIRSVSVDAIEIKLLTC